MYSPSVQLVDYDRNTNALTKLRDKKEKSFSDAKNLFKVRQIPKTNENVLRF